MEKFFYRVQKGDGVFSVAERFSLPVSVIINLNNLKREICEGDLLYIERPQGRTYRVRPFDTLKGISQRFCVSEQDLLKKNGVEYVFYGLTLLI